MRSVANISTIPSQTNLTRRAALGGSLAALALPTTAAAVCIAPGPDPIFEAIAAYKRGYAYHAAMLKKADVIEQAMWDDYHELCGLIDTNPDIVESFRGCIKGEGMATTENAVAMLKQTAHERARKTANMDECWRLRTEGSNAECDAMDAMLATVPTSRAGALALIEFVLGEAEGGETTFGDMFSQDPTVTTLLETMASFLRRQA